MEWPISYEDIKKEFENMPSKVPGVVKIINVGDYGMTFDDGVKIYDDDKTRFESDVNDALSSEKLVAFKGVSNALGGGTAMVFPQAVQFKADGSVSVFSIEFYTALGGGQRVSAIVECASQFVSIAMKVNPVSST